MSKLSRRPLGGSERRESKGRAVTAMAGASTTAALMAGLLPAHAAHADVTSFTNWFLNGNNTPVTPSVNSDGSELTLTDSTGNTDNSAFAPTKQDVTNFTVNYYYQDLNSAGADGYSFIIQNDPRGSSAVGDLGGSLGLSGTGQIVNSAGISFNVYANNGASADRYVVNGHTGAYLPTNTSYTTGDFIPVQLSYRAADKRLVEIVGDPSNPANVRIYTNVDIPTAVGSNTAWIGFTGGTGGQAVPQNIAYFSYTTGSAPAASSFLPAGVTFKPDMTPIAFTGYTQDMVIDANAPLGANVSSYVTATLDGGTNLSNTGNNTFYEQGYDTATAQAKLTGLPMGKTVQSQSAQAMANSTVQFGPANGKNALLLDTSHTTGKFTLNNLGRYSMLAIYETSGHGNTNTSFVPILHFADGSPDVSLAPITTNDWFGQVFPGTSGASTPVYQANYQTVNYGYMTSGRGAINGTVNNVGANNPRIYEVDYDISAYTNRAIASVSFNWGGTGGTETAVWALSGAQIAANNLVWNQAGGSWDTNASNTPWLNNGAASQFFESDNVTFGDTGVGTVAIGANAAPNSTTVNNSTGTYTFTGSGILSGTLTKNNAGTLVLNNGANGFYSVAVNGGQLSVAADASLGAGTATVTLNGGSLLSTGTFTSARTINLNGTSNVIDVSSGNTLTLTSAFGGTGGLVKGTGGGTLQLAQSGGYSTTGNLTVNGGALAIGGTGGATAPLSVGGTLNVADGAKASVLQATTPVANTVNNLNLNTSGTLDLANHSLLVTTTSNVAAYVARAAGPVQPNGLNAWTGSGLTSSLVQADAATGNTKQLAVGYFDSRDNANTGLSVPAGQTLVKETVYGDATGDGKVNIADLSVWNNNFGASSPRWSQGDFNYDGKVNIADLSVWNNNFGGHLSGPTPPSGAVASAASVKLTSSSATPSAEAATPPAGTLELDIDPSTGDAKLNSGGLGVAAIEIDSASGVLVPGNWKSLKNNYGYTQWAFPRGTPNASQIAEFVSDPSPGGQPANLAAGTVIDYGDIFPVGFTNVADLTFSYNLITDPAQGLTATRTGVIVVPEPTGLALAGVAAAGLLGRKRRRA